MRGHSEGSGVLSDYCDGSAYHVHHLFSCEIKALIMIYFDELELCNPRSKSKVHKIGITN